jgi:heterotetrameric sarcosine oxidase gamma subunit
MLRLFRPSDEEIARSSELVGFQLSVLPLRLTPNPPRNARIGPGVWIILDESSVRFSRLDGVSHHFSAVGHARVRWRLNAQGWEVLQRGCSLDLDPTQFVAGSCVRTLLAQAPVFILRPSNGPELEVIGDTSQADYLEIWLMDAATEVE